MLNKFRKVGLVLAVTITIVTVVPQNTHANLNSSRESAPSEWAEDDISEAERKGLITERIQGNYKNNITREEFSELAVLLYEELSRKEVTQQVDNPFTDTNNTKVIIANQLGLVEGVGDGLFSPDEKINREQASEILYKMLKIAKPKYDYTNVYEQGFKDNNEISSWAKESVGYLYGIEVINSLEEDYFKPKVSVSREEAIILVKRIHDKVSEADRASRSGLTVSRGSVKQPESDKVTQIRDVISKQLGKAYRYGASGPNNFDCSGLTTYVFGQLGIKLPRRSADQIGAGVAVSRDNLQYGDLVLFARNGKTINHVGIYVGNGNFAHSPQTGDVVKIQTMTSGYYNNCYFAARRVLQ